MAVDRADQRTALFSVALQSLANEVAVRKQLAKDFPAAEVYPLDQSFSTLTASVGTLPRSVLIDSVRRYTGRKGPPVSSTGINSAYLELLAALDVAPDSMQKIKPMAVTRSSRARGPSLGQGVNPLPVIIHKKGADWTEPECGCQKSATCDTVTLTFSTSCSVAKMAPYADPRNWPTCSAYWVSMQPSSLFPPGAGPGADWAGTFQEEVEVIPGYPMVTPLAFGYRQPTASQVTSSYRLLEPTDYVDVDEGSVTIAIDPAPPNPTTPTLITAVKAISWKKKSMQMWPTLLCDTFWGELGLDMACDCGNGP